MHLQDAQGRTPADQQQFSIRVVANKPAVIKPTFPGRDVNVSPLQEFVVEGKATDDFGLVNYGLEYSLAGGESREISLFQTSPDGSPVTTAQLQQLIDLESLSAAPDDMVTYTFWAEDRAADGSVRRVWSDLLFAEVRRFEEIFREDQQGAAVRRTAGAAARSGAAGPAGQPGGFGTRPSETDHFSDVESAAATAAAAIGRDAAAGC